MRHRHRKRTVLQPTSANVGRRAAKRTILAGPTNTNSQLSKDPSSQTQIVSASSSPVKHQEPETQIASAPSSLETQIASASSSLVKHQEPETQIASKLDRFLTCDPVESAHTIYLNMFKGDHSYWGPFTSFFSETNVNLVQSDKLFETDDFILYQFFSHANKAIAIAALKNTTPQLVPHNQIHDSELLICREIALCMFQRQREENLKLPEEQRCSLRARVSISLWSVVGHSCDPFDRWPIGIELYSMRSIECVWSIQQATHFQLRTEPKGFEARISFIKPKAIERTLISGIFHKIIEAVEEAEAEMIPEEHGQTNPVA